MRKSVRDSVDRLRGKVVYVVGPHIPENVLHASRVNYISYNEDDIAEQSSQSSEVGAWSDKSINLSTWVLEELSCHMTTNHARNAGHQNSLRLNVHSALHVIPGYNQRGK